jgi:carbon monoxide dehydrogenase subunit G
MELNNEFTVAVPVEETWKVLNDVERIAPCLPGAQLQEIDGDEYKGIVKVKVGPITAQYKGVARFLEQDEANHKVVLRAEGRDTKGAGNANATITAVLTAEGSGTKVAINTDLTITGKVAQFGRGVLADVSTKLIGQFADSLDAEVRNGNGTASVSPTPQPAADVAPPGAAVTPETVAAETEMAPSTGPRKIDSKPAEPVNLLDAAGGSMGKRVGPLVGGLVVVLWLLRRRRKKKK